MGGVETAMPNGPTPPDTSPRLIWAEDGSPRSGRFDDVYFSREDGLSETRTVFLEGCGLPGAWAGRQRFTVAELGFGTGLNIAALLELWSRTRPQGATLHVFSIEGFPLSVDEARRALSAWPELDKPVRAMLDAWPDGTPGFHRMSLPGLHAVIDVAIGDVAWALDQWSGRADAWFLDGFAPSTNPDMWSPQVLDLIPERSAPGARVGTFTVAGAVRRGLAERGFTADKRPGHGRKRERLEARLPGTVDETPAPVVAVVGAGIAGASMARALTEAGCRVTVVEATAPGAGGSGFPAALVTPRLDAGDAVIAGLHAQAMRHAVAAYQPVPGAVLARGVLQLEQTPRDAGRFAKIAAQPWWPPGAMTVLDAAACSARLGEDATGGLLMLGAGAVKPEAILSAWLGEATVVIASVDRLEPDGAGWRLLDASGAVIAVADYVVLASAQGCAHLAPDLPLSPVLGQADWVEGVEAGPVAWGGYAVPTGSGLLFGATHDRGQTEANVSDEASARNRIALAARLPRLAEAAAGPTARRAAVRATTPDRLPLAGPLLERPGVLVLTGLGSRGFCLAPLLAEHLAAAITGAASPLPRAWADRLSPARFAEQPLCNEASR